MRALLLGGLLMAASAVQACPDFLDTTLPRLHSSERVNLCELTREAKAVLIVNTASHCGYTRQFKGLEALHQAYKDQGLVVLGFPSASFNQEADDEAETAAVCYKNYGVTFPMFSERSVTGQDADPIFAALADRSAPPAWNFNKYLLVGNRVTHFDSRVEPMGSPLERAVQQTLAPATP